MSQVQEILAAVAALNEATAKCIEAREALNAHNTDVAAHPNILEIIDTILNSDTVYTKDQILSLVNEGIADHIEKTFQLAHPGWDDWETDNNEKYTGLEGRIYNIEQRLAGESGGSSATDLEKEIQAIEDKYAPILDNLQSALTHARDEGQLDLVDEYKKAIEKTLEEKNAEIMQAIEKYSS